MKAAYDDIRALTTLTPLWYDENGVPRYIEFHPSLSPNIYTTEVILIRIECQNCRVEFDVEMSYDHGMDAPYSIFIEEMLENSDVVAAHYGDPPRHGCVGDTMNSIPLKLIQFWSKVDGGWERIGKYEVEL